MPANYKGTIETGAGRGAMGLTLRDNGEVAGNLKVGNFPTANTGFAGRWDVNNGTFQASGKNTVGLQGDDPSKIVELRVKIDGDFGAESAGGVIAAQWNGNPHEWTFALKRVSSSTVTPGAEEQPLDPNAAPPAGTPTSDGDAINEAAAAGVLTRTWNGAKQVWEGAPSIVKWPVVGLVAYKVGDVIMDKLSGKKKKK